MSPLRALPRGLDAALRLADRLSRLAILLGGLMMLFSAFIIATDVILRRVFRVSTWGADELSYYALAISTSWAFAYAMLTKTHIRIAILTERLSPPFRATCDIIALLAMGFFVLMASWAIYALFGRSWRRGTTSITTLETPLWVPQGLWLAGFVFFGIVVALLLLRVLVALFIERSYEVAQRHGGAPTIAEETETARSEAEQITRERR